MLTSHHVSSTVTELSVSAWFYRNRTIAGFDNPARSLYVSIRELVENSLDACEAAGVLPAIWITLQRERAIEDHSTLISSEPEVFQLAVRDNGSGIPSNDVPKLIGKMLTGTKFVHKQARGTFGLGGSLALLYGQVTTQRPIEIVTALTGQTERHRLLMRLDIENNIPVVLENETAPKKPKEHGTSVTYHLEGDWIRSKRKIIDYLEQTSIIVPYASIRFDGPDEEVLTFKRLVEKAPMNPKEMKPHPRGVDVEMLKLMISQTRAKTLQAFMTSAFQRVGPTIAQKFLEYSNLGPTQSPKDLTDEDLLVIMRALTSFNGFLSPSSKSLSPAGEDLLAAGVMRLNPEVAVVRQRKPSVYEGNPFIVEVGAAYGGNLKSGVILYRFANRIPLLYDERSGVSSKVIRNLNLRSYGLSQDDPLAFFVHLCSTKVPYKTVGKEYIGDVDIVRKEIELGLKDCLRSLGEKVRRKHRATMKHKRQSLLEVYYQFMTEILSEATGRFIDSQHIVPKEESTDD